MIMNVYRSGDGVLNNAPENEYYANPRTEITALVPESTMRILDVGCGAGAFALAVKRQKAGREAWGIEINPTVAEEARQKLDKVLVGDINRLMEELPRQYFDAIVFNDVLEHLPDPYTVLSEMKAFLAPGGRILVSLPNVRHIRNLFNLLVRKDWAYTDHGVLDRTHLRFFTLKSALRTFREGGFQVETYRGIVSTKKWYMKPLNWLFLGYFEDTFHLQYAFRLKL